MRSDPAALAPERLLVFEVRGAISQFAAAIRRVPGLELVDEEELDGDADKAPMAYLLLPDVQALRQLESLWRRWQRNALAVGETPWRDVFQLLRDLRPWGPEDRLAQDEADILSDEIFGLDEQSAVSLEVELVYRASAATAAEKENEVRASITLQGGQVISRVRIEDIAYHALLVSLPVRSVRRIIDRELDSVAALEPVMHIRPQSLASGIEIADDEGATEVQRAGRLAAPILALLDGVPVAAHPALSAHLIVDDQFNLEPNTPVAGRVHGTAMASLIIHGDRNLQGSALPRRVHCVPVMGANDTFPANRLVVDLIYNAVLAMREGPNATAPEVVIVNISLGNARRPFHGRMSAWSRLLDRLAYRFGILFVVSAGNCRTAIGIEAYPTSMTFEEDSASNRARETLRGISQLVGERRLFSPGEAINGITVGACNQDAVSDANRASARAIVDPYGDLLMSNPSSALGPGFALGVKPDILMPGARERLRFVRNDQHIYVEPAGPTRAAGLKVASPPRGGRENVDGYTNGTSASAALASRTAHRIHDALDLAYGGVFRGLTALERAVLLKALLVHPAKWPDETAALIREVVGPANPQQHVMQKDNIRRFLGYGLVDADDAVACAADRATFWAVGMLEADKTATVDIPIPIVMGGKALPHFLSATLAWFAPTIPGRKSYRAVRLKILEPEALNSLRVKAHSNQPDTNQTNRGTVFTRCWSGDRAPVVGPDTTLSLTVQRDPDQGLVVDEPIPFGLAVTLSMPTIVEVYQQIRQRLGIPAPV